MWLMNPVLGQMLLLHAEIELGGKPLDVIQ